jgi:hypothetical protein
VLLAGYLVEWLGNRITILGVAGGYLLVTLSGSVASAEIGPGAARLVS